MLIEFTKMHGLGNDFMVIDLVTQRLDLTKDLVQLLGDRHLGIGFDQLLVVEPPMRPDVDFSYRIFNTDGTEVEQCEHRQGQPQPRPPDRRGMPPHQRHALFRRVELRKFADVGAGDEAGFLAGSDDQPLGRI